MHTALNFTVKLSLDETIGDLDHDRDQFRNCLMLLMENAFNRMSQIGTINVSTRKIGEHATVTLCYSVPNITDDDINDFFYPFTVSYPFKGRDADEDLLDVPVCKRIVHNHCGMITVNKEDKNNLWIDISLPLENL